MQLTLMGSSLYRLLGARLGHGYRKAKSRHLFRDIVQAAATVLIGQREILVRFQERAHDRLLMAAGFGATDIAAAWLARKRLRFVVGWPPWHVGKNQRPPALPT
ncbi:MAG TPA: hypothetical protein EYH34_07315 [Planctomycetes bacterium]|nr:hypothetical protein [Planctomycetota bacterium]